MCISITKSSSDGDVGGRDGKMSYIFFRVIT